MWDEHDHTSRWIQGICGLVLTWFALVAGYFVGSSPGFMIIIGGVAVFAGSMRYAWRCFYYAFTGKRNVNRDDY